jgi:2-oxoisovalerate dehydrogenase E1 component
VTKLLTVDPAEVRARNSVRFAELPVNAYKLDLSQEMALYGAEGLFNVLYDMILIREFETMLQAVTETGEWRGIAYDHRVAEHLAIGQEAAAVGQALELGPEDLMFGSHRSHGEVIAKSLTAIRELGTFKTGEVMRAFASGDTLRHAEAVGYDSAQELAENFTLFGLLAECFGRQAGFNRGLAGSLRAHFPPFGSMPNNPTVGAAAPLALGAALFKRLNHEPGIVVANLGDAAIASGAVWEAATFAAMDQFRTLWPASAGGHPALLLTVFNNFYGMGSQTAGETTGLDVLARFGAGVSREAMHAERVDGFNPLAVANAMRRKRELLENGQGPVLLDVVTYRFCGHWPSDAMPYRTPEEVAVWESADPITSYSQTLIHHAITTQAAIDSVRAKIQDRLQRILARAADNELCPRPDRAFLEAQTWCGETVDTFQLLRKAELSEPLGDNARLKAISQKARKARDEDGQPVSKLKAYQLRDGLYEAVAHRFSVDSTMAAWGQDVRDWGGAFAVYRGLAGLVPVNRLFNAPVAQSASLGAGIGYALAGGRALVEIMYEDLLGRAGDELLNQMGSWRALSGGLLKTPLVVRCCAGTQWSGPHAQDLSGIAARVPGLKVYYPTTPADAKGMLNLALSGTDPVLFLESQQLYDKGEEFERDGVPLGYYVTAEGEPALRREGSDITIAAFGPAVYRALEAAQRLQERHQTSAEVIDLRFLRPLKLARLMASVRKTGRLLLVSDEPERGSFLHTVAGEVQEAAFDVLDSPPVVLGARDLVVTTPDIVPDQFPQAVTIIDAINRRILPLSFTE